MATTVQAIIAAVKLDGGETAVETVMTRLRLSHNLLVTFKNTPSYPSTQNPFYTIDVNIGITCYWGT